MSSVSAISTSPSTLQSSNVSMQDFLNILLTQLTYQDPLKPMDSQEFMAQLAQFTTLGQTQELNDKMGSLLSTQASMQSIGLISRTVSFSNAQGVAQSGMVQSLSWAGSSPLLSVIVPGSSTPVQVDLSQVTLVR